MRCVRIWFAKEGKVKYISHLDVMRCMSRAVRRARLPLWYTEGFNPHPYMMFALPLSLGFSSQCESMDIRIEGEMTDADIAGRMRDVMPEGLRLLSVRDISPALLLDALEEKAGVQDVGREITRLELLTKDLQMFE